MSLWIGLYKEVGLNITLGHWTEHTLDIETTKKAIEYINTISKERVSMPRKEVWCRNITHNLTRMAMAVEVGDDLTLYDIMWHPDDHFEDVTTTKLFPYLMKALKELDSAPDRYYKYNPSNGFGSYNTLLSFVQDYTAKCMEFGKCIVYAET